ncbi:hypothetical protein WSM22_30390 [Cytophagales bacterium WSM2-2]|nr:hypothetical protein WSM22_30390 [Cytophagales bacterium WSM2-2]
MLFWKKKEDRVIQCSICGWTPDGVAHWRCTCGHQWNTFKTRGKCPACNFQWEKTWCPGCGEPTLHESWYKTRKEIEEAEKSADPVLLASKKRLEARLLSYGINSVRIKHLPYLDHTQEVFLTPYEAGCRMLIMYSISYLTVQLEEREQVCEWLKEEKIWNVVSPLEKKFFADELPDQRTLDTLSWYAEGALTLGWSLNKVKALPRMDESVPDHVINEFENAIPAIGDSVMIFLTKLEFRGLAEIYEENILNELITGYFRDQFLNGRLEFDTTKINRAVSFERHRVLNWLRTYIDTDDENPGEAWDHVDMST